MSAITQSKPETIHRTSKNSETKAPKAKADEVVKPIARVKQQDCLQLDDATNRSADSINVGNRSVEDCPQESEKGTASKSQRIEAHCSETQAADTQAADTQLEAQAESDPVMVQPADLWRKNCSKPHRI
ncbi:MAG: hypothetical protein WA783_20485 [Phormidesmis sp.]